MKYCEDYAALLDPYIDGELPPEDAARVREHLAVCAGCRAYVQAALLLRENFPEIEETEVPDGFAESVMGAIRSGAAPRKKRRTPWIKVLAPLAACCAIVILVKSLPMDAATADTASAGIVAEETVPETAQAQDDTAAARNSEPEAAETEEPPVAEASTPTAETAGETPEIGTKTGTAADAVQPHAYTAQTNGQEDAGTASGDTGAVTGDTAGTVTENAGAGADEAAQPEAQGENSVAAAATTAQDTAWFATLTLTPAQAGTALETLPDDVPVSNDPDTGGTVYWLNAEQFETLLAQLGHPAYTAEGEGDLARVILLPE